jgi:hypothetical protein
MANRLEEGLRTFNDGLVRELSTVMNSDVLGNLAKVAVASGGDGRDALAFARGAAGGDRDGKSGPAVTVLQIRLNGALQPLSAGELTRMVNGDEATKFVTLFLRYLATFIDSQGPVWINAFPDGLGGPVELAVHPGGFTWIDVDRDRPVTDRDLRNVSRESLEAALEEVAERMAKGLRGYFGPAVTDQTPRSELLVKFDFEARNAKRAVDDLKVCMNAAGFPL